MSILDRSGEYYCPCCGGQHAFHYEEIPEHRRLYVDPDGTEVTEYMPAIRDYECSDCGWKWSVDNGQGT